MSAESFGTRAADRKSVVEGKRGDLGGRRIVKKKRGNRRCSREWSSDVCSSDLQSVGATGFKKALLNGWNVSGILRYESGRSEERRGGEEGRSRGAPDR